MAGNLTTRKGVSICLAALLYTAATPFTPISWLIRDEAGFLLDRLLAGILLFSALYFQWRIASLAHPLMIMGPSTGGTTMRNGRIERGAVGDVLFVWRPDDMFWPCAVGEGVVLMTAHFGPSETIRRLVVCSVVAGSWFVGWSATPQSTKDWAWKQIKELWIWMLIWEVLGVGSRVGTRPRRAPVRRW